VAACGGSSAGGGGSGSSQFTIVEASNGFGRLLPYEIPIRDSQGNPTSRVIEITTEEDLVENVTPANPILPPTAWPGTAILPNRAPGNHFIFARFNQDIDVDSVLTSSISAVGNNNLAGAIQVVEFDATTQATRVIPGRAFVGGFAYGPSLNP